MNRNRKAQIILLAGATSLLAGCAWVDRRVTLTYPPPQTAPTGSAIAADAPPLPQGRELTLLTVIDQRSEKGRIGVIRNTFGMKTADVLAANDVAEWVTKALAYELRKAGYRVNEAKSRPPNPMSPVVASEVGKVECDAYFKYGGDVDISVTVSDGSREIIRRTYQGQGGAGTNWSATADSFGRALSSALESAIRSFIDELRRELPIATP